MDWDLSIIQRLSPLALILVFAGGALTSIGPCNMAMIPLIIGYVGGSRDLSRGRSFILLGRVRHRPGAHFHAAERDRHRRGAVPCVVGMSRAREVCDV